MKNEAIEQFAKTIESKVLQLHEGRTTWDKETGMWLVYGFERTLGFIGAAEFESVVERAWRSKKPIAPAIVAWFADFGQEGA